MFFKNHYSLKKNMFCTVLVYTIFSFILFLQGYVIVTVVFMKSDYIDTFLYSSLNQTGKFILWFNFSLSFILLISWYIYDRYLIKFNNIILSFIFCLIFTELILLAITNYVTKVDGVTINDLGFIIKEDTQIFNIICFILFFIFIFIYLFNKFNLFKITKKLSIFLSKNYKNFIYWNLFTSYFLIACFITIFITTIKLPFPEKFSIGELDSEAKAAGQHIALLIYYIFGSISIVVFLINFIFSLIVYKYFFLNSNYSKKYHIYFSLHLFVSFITIFWFLWKIRNKTEYINDDVKCVKRINKITLFSTILGATFMAGFFVYPTTINYKIPHDRKKDVNSFFTLSKSNQNTMVFYFDRTAGSFWNLLLTVDYIKNQNNSLIKQFPEFTSYVNSISIGKTTNFSNTSMNGGALFHPLVLNQKDAILNLTSKKIKTSDMTQDKFLLHSYLQEFESLKKQGYNNFSICNPPYYDIPYKYQTSSNTKKLQNDLNNQKNDYNFDENTKFVALDINNIAREKNTKFYVKGENKQREFVKQFRNFKDDIIFTDDKNPRFLESYYNHTHQDYSWYEDKKLITQFGIETKKFLKSIWFTINDFKEILKRLKNEKHNNGGTVYDHTNILVISDHGFDSFYDTKKESKTVLNNIHNFLIKNKYMTKQESDNLIKAYKTNIMNYNSLFMYKPTKYKKTDWNKNIDHENPIKTFFNKDNLFLSSDIPYYLEELAMRYKLDQNNTYNELINENSNYKSHALEINDNKLSKIINDLKIELPILNANKTLQREALLVSGEWRWKYNDKKMKIKNIAKLNFVNDEKGIFDIKKWKFYEYK